MAYIYGQHFYGEYRYSWLTEWVPQMCERPDWQGVPCTVSPWVTVQRSGAAWQGVVCDG